MESNLMKAMGWLRPGIIASVKEAPAGNRYHWVSGAGIYYNTYPVKYAHPETFVFLHGFAKDKSRCYRMGTAYKDADPDTFEVLNRYFARDKHHIYNREGVDKKVDYASFEVLDSGYITDEDGILRDATSYARDKNGLWMMTYYAYKPVAIKGMDTASFERINDCFARDNKQVTWNGKKIKKADTTGFTAFNINYGRDAGHIICQDRILDGADYSTFETIPQQVTLAKDKDNYYQFDRNITQDEFTALIKDNTADK